MADEDDDMSFDDFSSELSDPPSTEEDIPLSKTSGKAKGKAKAASTGYQIKDALRPPRTAQYTAKSLYDQIIDNTIDLDPEYQRDIVWTEQKQSGMIDSILRNYYIPPVIFAVSSSDDGSELRTCIDGKQRLTSIQRFMDGLIPHKDSITNQKLWYKQVGNTKRKLLPKQYMQQFAYKQITCVEYETLTDDQEREIFQRVQLGVALTPAERMQAITGPWPTLIREIQQEVLGESGFEGHLQWGHGRGLDFRCLTSIVYLIHKPKLAFPGVPQLEKWLQETDAVPSKFRNEIFDVFRVFVELVRKFRSVFHKPTKVAPVEFVMIGSLIHTYRTKLSLTQLSSAIEKLRVDVRAKYADIRQNAKVTKTMLEFIKKKVKVSELKSDKQGDTPASCKARPTQTSSAPKRKRAIYSDGDSSESESLKPPPAKSSTSRAVAGSSKPEAVSSGQLRAAQAKSSGPTAASKTTSKPKTPAKSPPTTKPAPKSAMPTSSTTSATAGSSKLSAPRPFTSTPRIPKISGNVPRTTSPQIMPSSSSQRRQSIPPPRPPSPPPSQQPVKREFSTPLTFGSTGLSDRLGAIHIAPSSQIQSPVIPGSAQPIQDPQRATPQIQTNMISTSLQQPAWIQSPVVGSPSFPSGTPLDQSKFQELLATITTPSSQPQTASGSPVVQQSLNGAVGGQLSSGTPPMTSHAPAFVQNLNNPLHSQLSSDSVQNRSSSAAPSVPESQPATPISSLPPQASHALSNGVAPTVNGSIMPTSLTHALPPRPSSATTGVPPSNLSFSSAASGSRYNSFDQPRSSRGRSYDYDRGSYGGYKNRGRSRSRERDNGWGSRGRNRTGVPRSPSYDRYGGK